MLWSLPSLIVFPLKAHVCCAASPAVGDRGFVCPAAVPPSCLNKGEDWQRERSCVPAPWLVWTGVSSKWNSGYVMHNEDRRGFRLPQVLFCLNGMHAVRWDGRRESCSLYRDRNTWPPLLHTRSAFHFRFLITKLHAGNLSVWFYIADSA